MFQQDTQNDAPRQVEWRRLRDPLSDYRVGDDGSIVSYVRGVPTRLSPTWVAAQHLLIVQLRGSDGKAYRRTVTRLVAECFLLPRGPGQVIVFVDGDRRNNARTNLVYTSRADAHRHYQKLNFDQDVRMLSGAR